MPSLINDSSAGRLTILFKMAMAASALSLEFKSNKRYAFVIKIRGESPTANWASSHALIAPTISFARSLAVDNAHQSAICSSILDNGGGGNDSVAVNSAIEVSILPSAPAIAANSA